jgi:flavin-dependent dehydrogenase
MEKVIILGGGLGGLITSIKLALAGIPCLVIEKKSYPFHRVCGEYISNEATPFLEQLNLFPAEFTPPLIKRFQLSSSTGRNTVLPLDLGGFGISRYTYDYFLYQKAKTAGVNFLLNTEVESVTYLKDKFEIRIAKQTLHGDIVIGSFGKRSKLDIQLNRNFIKKRSPYVGVKYHIRRDHPADLIALHNFESGYCGISNIEAGKTNLCYLAHRDTLRRHGSIEHMEKEVLFRNPLLKTIFSESEFVFSKPEVINEISFETKAPVENHVLMVGDAAGMITPLCGNGMAMAMHGAKLASELVIRYFSEKEFSRQNLETTYREEWRRAFTNRLWKGRQVQRLFGNKILSNLAVNLAIYSSPIAQGIIRNTHGKIF